ncbi:hypothetical protein DPMN_179981 [Dreissena polymorpha]|uniref:Fibrinogen C-terminal domain-containing protein n=1 Tax=Dreissena polymorpha TaxID=45954 RepID=A0A9D4EI92_DREPO|nr:hypothetical protein DPMN_179981 [Dreissena polymorpha]
MTKVIPRVTLNVAHFISYIHVSAVTLQFVPRSNSTMKVFTTLVAIWSIYIFQQYVEALICLQCDFVEQPRYCKTVISCPDDDSCFVEKQANAFSEIGYNLGCLAKRSCRNSVLSSSHCTQCCDKDLCNNAGCGEQGYPYQRGPVCYSCDNPSREGRCHSIDVCREGEVCSLNGEDTFGTILFTSGCMPKDHCVTHSGGDLIVGRRSDVTSTLTWSRGLHDCFHCCDADLCNTNCQTKVDGKWGSWTAWSLCTSLCYLTRTRACDNPAPLHNGRDCAGLTMQTHDCYTDQCQPKDCSELLSSGAARRSGVYNITTPVTQMKIQVYCDMETEGGGWTIFQRRFNGSEDFYRNFSDYENGFGSVHAEHWLGLKYVYEITSQGSYQLRVDILRSNGSRGYDVYGEFSLQPGTNYTLNIGSRLRSNNVDTSYSFSDVDGGSPAGNAFSTYDHAVTGSNCSGQYKAGWWFNRCFDYINLNSLYRPGQSATDCMAYDSRFCLAASTIMFKRV